MHFTLENTTHVTRVSLDFRIAIYRERIVPAINKQLQFRSSKGNDLDAISEIYDQEESDLHDSLCNQKLLQDNYSKFEGYYEEAHIDLGSISHSSSGGPGGTMQSQDSMVHKNNKLLMHPDKRVGFPF